MVGFPERENYCEFVFRKETKNGLEFYILRYSPTQTAEKQTTRVLERWVNEGIITNQDLSYILRQTVSIKRKSLREIAIKL